MLKKTKLAISFGALFLLALPFFVMAAESTCFPETTSVATTTLKTLSWNLHGEALNGKILPGQDWANLDASVKAILGVINNEKPSLVVFDAVHTKFEKKLKDEIAKSGYVYSYINTALPKTDKNFKKAIFSKEKILESKTHTANFKQILSGEKYAANNSILEVKINLLGNVYSIFAGGVTPGRNQLALNNNYFAQNVYSLLIQANKPHFILGDFNMFLDFVYKEWFNTVYLAKENFPSASFYVNNYKDVCVVYPGAGCGDSTPPADGSGRIDQTIFRDYTDKQTIKVVKSYIRQDTENNFQISDHFPIVAEFMITGTKVTPGYCSTPLTTNVITNNTILGPTNTTISTSSASSSNSSNYLFPLNIKNNSNVVASSSASSSSVFKLLQYFSIPGKNVYPNSAQTFSLGNVLDIKSLVVNWSDNKTDCQAQVSVGNNNSGWKDVSSPGSFSLANVGKADRISISAKNAGAKCSGVAVSSINITGYTQ